MLQNIKPQPKFAKSKDGSLTVKEKSLAKGLLKLGCRAQDITFIMNQGRIATVNQARVSETSDNISIVAANEEEVREYLKVQSSYDPKTLLNPHLDHRIIRAREAMSAAVQIFNSPTISFKTEIFCTLANIAWTYLLHEKLERTQIGSSKLANGDSVTLNGTLDKNICPIKDIATAENLKKVIEIRNAVEHTYFEEVDECFGALFQACCINFEHYITEWFGKHTTLAKDLSLALQFVRLNKEQIIKMEESNFPQKIRAINQAIQTSPYADNNAFQLTVFYTTEISSKTNADLHKLVDHQDSSNTKEVVIKKQQLTYSSQKDIVNKIKQKGYNNFSEYEHQKFWQSRWSTASKRSKEAKKFGGIVHRNQWLWYLEVWLPEVLSYCSQAGNKFK